MQKNPNSKMQKNLNIFNFKSQPLPNLTLPQNIQIKSLQFSTDGQEGVIFMELQQGAFIIKPGMNVGCEIFYNLLAGELGVRVPRVGVFTGFGVVYDRIWGAIEVFCMKRDQCLLARLKPRFLNVFYTIIQYHPSISFQHIGAPRFQSHLSTPQTLHQLGVCLGYDLIVNNNDRLQLLWSGEGNINNILIQVPKFHTYDLEEVRNRSNESIVLGSYVFIDNQGNMCNVGDQFTRGNVCLYFGRVREFFKQLLEFVRLKQDSQVVKSFMQNKYIVKLIKHIQLYTGHQLNSQQILEIMYGTKDCIQLFIYYQKTNKIQQILSKVRKMIDAQAFLHQQWNQQLAKINLSYCQLLREYIEPMLIEYRQRSKVLRKEEKEGKEGRERLVGGSQQGEKFEVIGQGQGSSFEEAIRQF